MIDDYVESTMITRGITYKCYYVESAYFTFYLNIKHFIKWYSFIFNFVGWVIIQKIIKQKCTENLFHLQISTANLDLCNGKILRILKVGQKWEKYLHFRSERLSNTPCNLGPRSVLLTNQWVPALVDI